jgi:hypothetical protein
MLPARALRKAGVVAAYPWARFSFGRRSFDSPYGPLRYFVHPYNHTWRYERCIEIPIARAFIAAHGGAGLEVGNVLNHYGRVSHRVVDKYERGRDVENVDVEAIQAARLDYIVSISTLEHVGIDERDRDEQKALRSIGHLRGPLAPSGRLLVTFRLGHNPTLTEAVLSGRIPVELEAFYRPHWIRIGIEEARALYDPDHHDLVWVGVLTP